MHAGFASTGVAHLSAEGRLAGGGGGGGGILDARPPANTGTSGTARGATGGAAGIGGASPTGSGALLAAIGGALAEGALTGGMATAEAEPRNDRLGGGAIMCKFKAVDGGGGQAEAQGAMH